MQVHSELPMHLEDEAATIAAADALARALPSGAFVITLAGPLGAGKSSFARALLRALGVGGAIPSPSFALVEPYDTSRGPAYHVDLYRLRDAGEVQMLDLEDMRLQGALVLIEWPERAGGLACDLALDFDYADRARSLGARAQSAAGELALSRWRTVAA